MSSSSSSRQHSFSARLFLADLSIMLAQALTFAPEQFETTEIDFMSKLIIGLEQAEVKTESEEHGGVFDNQAEFIKYVNDLYMSLTKTVTNAKAMAMLVKAQEVLSIALEAKLFIIKKVPHELYNLIVTNLSLRGTVTSSDNFILWQKLWEFVNNDPSSSGKVAEVGGQAKGVTGILPALNWVPNGLFCYIVANVLVIKYPFGGRVQHGKDSYAIVQEKLAEKYSGPDVVASDKERAGMCIAYQAYHSPEKPVSDLDFNQLSAAVSGSTAMSKVSSATLHWVGLFKANVINKLSASGWCDINDYNGNSLWQFRDGNSTTDINTWTYSINLGNDRYYPADSIMLNTGDTAIVTDVPQLKMTGIIQNGLTIPDVLYYKDQVY